MPSGRAPRTLWFAVAVVCKMQTKRVGGVRRGRHGLRQALLKELVREEAAQGAERPENVSLLAALRSGEVQRSDVQQKLWRYHTR